MYFYNIFLQRLLTYVNLHMYVFLQRIFTYGMCFYNVFLHMVCIFTTFFSNRVPFKQQSKAHAKNYLCIFTYVFLQCFSPDDSLNKI